MCKKYRGIVLAHLFIRALLVLMRVAVLESVFCKYWLPWCLMVIECFWVFRVACCDNVSWILYLHLHIPGSMCVVLCCSVAMVVWYPSAGWSTTDLFMPNVGVSSASACRRIPHHHSHTATQHQHTSNQVCGGADTIFRRHYHNMLHKTLNHHKTPRQPILAKHTL